MKVNIIAATLLLYGSVSMSPTRTRLQHWSLGSKQRQSSMAETEIAMEDKNNVTSNITLDGDTDAEPQKILLISGYKISYIKI